MGKKDHHALLEKKKEDSPDGKNKTDYSLSYFPSVCNVPIELQPFEKKARLVSLVQRRKFKQFVRESKAQEKYLKIARTRQLAGGMREDPLYNDHSAVSVLKVKQWMNELSNSTSVMSGARR